MTDKRALQWISGHDVGVSSKTIWSVIMDTVPENPHVFYYGVPHDADDFGRCYRLLELIPEWRNNLHLVAAKFPLWGPIVSAWNSGPPR